MARQLPSHPIFDLNVRRLTLIATLQDGSIVSQEFLSDEIPGHFQIFKDKCVNEIRNRRKDARQM